MINIKEKKSIKKIELEIAKYHSEKAKSETEKILSELENTKLQIQYEEMYKNIEKKTMSLAEGVSDVLNSIGKGEK
jgi:hypothetical protein